MLMTQLPVLSGASWLDDGLSSNVGCTASLIMPAPAEEAEAPTSIDMEDPWADAAARQRAHVARRPQTAATVTMTDRKAPHSWDAFFDASLRKKAQQLTTAARASGRFAGPASNTEASPPFVGEACVTDERISHILSRTLRYHWESAGLVPTKDGWFSLSALIAAIPELHGTSEERVRSVASQSTSLRGRRFEVRKGDNADGHTEIKALYRYPPDVQRDRGFRRRRGGWGVPSELPHSGDGSWQYHSRPRQRLGFSHGPELTSDHETCPLTHGVLAKPHADGSDAAEPCGGSTQANDCGLPAENSATSSSSASCGHGAELNAKQVEVACSSTPPSTVVATAAGSSDTASAWQRYLEPGCDRCWFMNDDTEEAFYADDLESGWQRYLDSQGKPWWEHQASGRHFYEP